MAAPQRVEGLLRRLPACLNSVLNEDKGDTVLFAVRGPDQRQVADITAPVGARRAVPISAKGTITDMACRGGRSEKNDQKRIVSPFNTDGFEDGDTGQWSTVMP